MPQTIRNIAIIAALAAAVDFLPGGGNAAQAVLTALTMLFLAAIAWLLYRVYNEQQLTLSTLTDAKKAGLFGAVGGIAHRPRWVGTTRTAVTSVEVTWAGVRSPNHHPGSPPVRRPWSRSPPGPGCRVNPA